MCVHICATRAALPTKHDTGHSQPDRSSAIISAIGPLVSANCPRPLPYWQHASATVESNPPQYGGNHGTQGRYQSIAGHHSLRGGAPGVQTDRHRPGHGIRALDRHTIFADARRQWHTPQRGWPGPAVALRETPLSESIRLSSHVAKFRQVG